MVAPACKGGQKGAWRWNREMILCILFTTGVSQKQECEHRKVHQAAFGRGPKRALRWNREMELHISITTGVPRKREYILAQSRLAPPADAGVSSVTLATDV